MSALDSRGATEQRVAGGGSRADLNRLGRGSAANLVGAGVAALTTFALTVVVTRGVSKQDAGLFFAASSLFILASTLGQLGTPTGLVYFLSRNRVWGTPERIPAYVRTAVRPCDRATRHRTRHRYADAWVADVNAVSNEFRT